jgi:hypothetical protein
MKQFKIVPLSKEYANKIRETKKDEFGHEVIRQLNVLITGILSICST